MEVVRPDASRIFDWATAGPQRLVQLIRPRSLDFRVVISPYAPPPVLPNPHPYRDAGRILPFLGIGVTAIGAWFSYVVAVR